MQATEQLEAATEIAVRTQDITAPKGFRTHAGSIGIKDGTPDYSVIVSAVPCVASGVFTRSLFAGASVTLCRERLIAGQPQAIVTVSKNANVATGAGGLADARELAALTAQALTAQGVECPPDEVLVCSTGVIGRRYPMDRIRAYFSGAHQFGDADLPAVARAIMTTDTVPKLAQADLGEVSLCGIAKGVGMIEPDMATLLTYFVTDAQIAKEDLDPIFARVMDQTFNCLSVDTDTSTSDSAIILANGQAGPVDLGQFEAALHAVALSLVQQVARDGEGATKLLKVTVTQARDRAQAKRLAKAVVNSPLVKTAVHGADPNWGRVVMAIGKCSDDTDVTPDTVRVRFAGVEVYPDLLTESGLAELAKVLRGDEVEITVTAGSGQAEATVWGCDLSDGYVRINADYTT
jgi:glutamate N-acetyltransferase / amino-acid N-acetyltransferase